MPLRRLVWISGPPDDESFITLATLLFTHSAFFHCPAWQKFPKGLHLENAKESLHRTG